MRHYIILALCVSLALLNLTPATAILCPDVPNVATTTLDREAALAACLDGYVDLNDYWYPAATTHRYPLYATLPAAPSEAQPSEATPATHASALEEPCPDASTTDPTADADTPTPSQSSRD